jgi:hypothetical protein
MRLWHPFVNSEGNLQGEGGTLALARIISSLGYTYVSYPEVLLQMSFLEQARCCSALPKSVSDSVIDLLESLQD